LGKQEGKKLTKKSGAKKREAAQNQREGASPSLKRCLPKPLRRRGCERKQWDEKGEDVPGGIRNAGSWRDKRMKN